MAVPAENSLGKQTSHADLPTRAGLDAAIPEAAPLERGAETASRPAAGLAAPAELPRTTVLQIIEALRAGTGRVDVTLWPEELGRLTMTLGANDGAMLVNVTAERPETLELIRRNVDLLLAEARAAGFSDVAFGFTGQEGTGAGNEAFEEEGSPPLISADTPGEVHVRGDRLPASGTLDLRI